MKKAKTLLTLLTLAVCTSYAKETKPLTPPSAKTLHFTENKGQVTNQHLAPRADIDFKLATDKGLNIFIGKGKIAYQWAKPTTTDKEKETTSYDMYRLDLELIGANKQASVITEGQQTSHERYFQPWINTSNSNKGVQAHAYHKITYRDIYPHIDWVFYFNNKGQLEHDFIVRPGGKIADIKMKYTGADKLQHNTNGSFTATTSMGSITENAPIAYEQKGRAVSVKFELNEGILSFTAAPYSGTLIIDPVIEWGTYFGGAGDDEALDLATDKWDNVYMCGGTNSVANIATTGTHQATFATGNKDAFVSKWNTDGALIWATYYGGAMEDIAKGIACDTSGNVYVGGNSNSLTGIATTGSAQEIKGGNPAQNRHDAFLVKLDSTGNRQWATYLGGNNHDGQLSFDLAMDAEQNIYITGNTLSTDLSTTPGAHQMTKAGTAATNDGFISKYNSNGNVAWMSYFGGTSHDYPYALATDNVGNIYIAGNTLSINGIATTGTHQQANGGGEDAFIASFNSSGQQLWGTYFGGLNGEWPKALSVTDTKLLIGGLTTTNGLATPNAHQPAKANGEDGFLAAFNLLGQLEWCTYYGGAGTDVITGIASNSLGELYTVGKTNSDTGISTAGAYQQTRAGAYDIVLAKFSDQGQRIWGTYYGGTDIDDNANITLANDYTVCLTGRTNSAIGIAINGFQNTLNGSIDALLVKINDCSKPASPSVISGGISVCANTENRYAVTNDTSVAYYTWILPDGWMGISDTNSIDVQVSALGGLIKVLAVGNCGAVSDTVVLDVTVLPAPQPTIVNNNFLLSTTQVFTTYQWLLDNADIAGATSPTHIATADGLYALRVADANACEGISPTVNITGTVSVDNLVTNVKLQLFPNPTTATVCLKAQEAGVWDLINVEGKLIKQGVPFNAGLTEIDLTKLSKGLYVVKVTTGSGYQVFKIAKQ